MRRSDTLEYTSFLTVIKHNTADYTFKASKYNEKYYSTSI